MTGKHIFSVDAESDGIYGPIWAIGAVVVNENGMVVAEFGRQIDSGCVVDPWVKEHIVPVVRLHPSPSSAIMIDEFRAFWMQWRGFCIAVADFGVPVEARLFRDTLGDYRSDYRSAWFKGPYPLNELGTMLLAAGVDPDIDRVEYSRLTGAVKHNPVDDAKMAAACWIRARDRIELAFEIERHR